MSKPVILTGLRANNDLHIGNYLGALLPIIDMAKKRAGEFQVNLFIPDLHSFTTEIDFKRLKDGIYNNLKLFVAAGLPLDNPDVHIYRQSYIPAHSELAWILDCFSGIGELQRMTQFKDKSASLNADRISVGLFNYPVLMAADILLYGASYVPVGDDQSQHLEFTRDIGERLNTRFNDLFTIPRPVKEQHQFFGKDQGLRIKDLSDPAKKMSKSDASGKGVIFLNDSLDSARQKIMSATTDSLNNVSYDRANQAGITNLLELQALLNNQELTEVINTYENETQYGKLKQDVANSLCNFLDKFQKSLQSVDEAQLNEKLAKSEELMRQQANMTLHKVQSAIGLR